MRFRRLRSDMLPIDIQTLATSIIHMTMGAAGSVGMYQYPLVTVHWIYVGPFSSRGVRAFGLESALLCNPIDLSRGTSGSIRIRPPLNPS